MIAALHKIVSAERVTCDSAGTWEQIAQSISGGVQGRRLWVCLANAPRTTAMNIDKCPKCGAKMEEGFLTDGKFPTRWMADKPQTSVQGDATAPGREQRRIESFRCIECGHLELYARALIS
ncbi:MAG TPA: PF20097 family protein [Verrucomicrobiae bacterium]|nr:PF20097 family protein [Verrucomicrobiae bacterium]